MQKKSLVILVSILLLVMPLVVGAITDDCSYQTTDCNPCAGKQDADCSRGSIQIGSSTSLCSDNNVYSYSISYKLGTNSRGYACRYDCVATNKKLIQDCNVQPEPVIPTCTSFTYSTWSVCDSSGTQIRTVTSSSPNGCTGGVGY